MKKLTNIVIKSYTFATLVEQGGKAQVYFMNTECENECLMLPFINGFEETNFLMNCFGYITRWYKGIDAWKNKEIKVAYLDERPMALIDKVTEEICLIKSPIFIRQNDLVIQNGNLLYLKQEYGLLEEQFKMQVREERQKEKKKVYQKKI